MTSLEVTAEEQLAYGVAQRASEPLACGRWAHVEHELAGTDRDPQLWPRDRGAPQGPGYRITALIARKGIRRILLTPSPRLAEIGISVDTMLTLLFETSQWSHSAIDLLAPALSAQEIDQIIQVGLFEEVLYR
jgi:hypothetical protein